MTDTPNRLKDLIVRVLMLEGVAPDDINADAPLFGKDGLGLDSVDALELAIHIEEELGVRIPEDAEGRKAFATVASLAAYVDSRRAAGGA